MGGGQLEQQKTGKRQKQSKTRQKIRNRRRKQKKTEKIR